MTEMIDISYFLSIVGKYVQDKKVPVVDLIAVQTRDPFKVLVATILSARTKDETTAKAAARLFDEADTVEALSGLTRERLEKLIHPVGFFRNKAKYLEQLPKALSQFDSMVPDTMEQLLTLPGVGRKTANLVLAVAFAKPAICVDTHVHRIMNIWRYVDTTTPLETEMALRDKLPRQYWLTVNSILVAFGQLLCRPISPHCDKCPLVKDCPQHNVTPRKTRKAKGSKPSGNPDSLKLISWNVNGIRAMEKKGFADIVVELDADILALQETKAHPDQLGDSLKNLPGYDSYWCSAEKKGYSGVALYTRLAPISVKNGIGIQELDQEGRVITAEFDHFYLINIYFPNSGDKLKRLNYKLAFNQALLSYSEELRSKKPVVLCGDFNVAHKPIDLKNPDNNRNNAGYTVEECNWMDSFIEAGYLDTFRIFNQEPEQYSWWSYRFNARARNIGWRIDYFCTDKESRARVLNGSILSDVMGSDHCPVHLEYQAK